MKVNEKKTEEEQKTFRIKNDLFKVVCNFNILSANVTYPDIG